MAKTTNYSSVDKEVVIINFNQERPDGKFTPAVITVRCDALTDEGAIRTISKSTEVGTPTSTKLTLKQIYNAVNKNATGGIVAGVLKDAFLEAIDVDPSI